MEGVDFNSILVPLVWLLAIISIVSGAFLVLRSFLRFRYQVNQSVNMDLEMVRVTRKQIDNAQAKRKHCEKTVF